MLAERGGFPAGRDSGDGRPFAQRAGSLDRRREFHPGNEIDAGKERRVADGVECLVCDGGEMLPVVPFADSGDDFTEEFDLGWVRIGQELHESAQALELDAQIMEVVFIAFRPAGELAKKTRDGSAELLHLKTGGRKKRCRGYRREGGGKLERVVGQIAAQPPAVPMERFLEARRGALAQLADAAKQPGKGIGSVSRREGEREIPDDIQIANLACGFADGVDGLEEMGRRLGADGRDGLDAARTHAKLVQVFRRGVTPEGFELLAQLAQRPLHGGEVHHVSLC